MSPAPAAARAACLTAADRPSPDIRERTAPMTFDLPYSQHKPIITIPGEDLVSVDVTPPADSDLIREAATASAVIAVVPEAPELRDVVKDLVDHLDAIRTGDAELAFAEYRGAILERAITDTRIRLRDQAERFLFSGVHFIEEPIARLVHVVAVLPAIALTAEVRMPRAHFWRGVQAHPERKV